VAASRGLTSYTEFKFWERLDAERGAPNCSALILCVEKVCNAAVEIAKQIPRYMPEYTHHDERHFLNVLGIMEMLVPDAVMEELTPLECALCILSAFTHDLGMALSADALRDLSDDPDESAKYQTYRDGHGELTGEIDRWSARLGEPTDDAARAADRVTYLEGFLLASYIRDTHTEADDGRIREWLDAIADDVGNPSLYMYGRYDIREALVWIDRSHNEDVHWLRRQFGEEGEFHRLLSGERSNLAFPGLLLRLADIMDFDATRAPAILFRHIGIENDTSILEWRKHMSIDSWSLDTATGDPDLLYSAICEHPVYEKAIREFCGKITAEFRAVSDELAKQKGRAGGADSSAARRKAESHWPV